MKRAGAVCWFLIGGEAYVPRIAVVQRPACPAGFADAEAVSHRLADTYFRVFQRAGANYAHARMAGAQLSIGWPPDAEAAGEGLVGAVLVRQGYPTGTGEMLV